MGPDYQAMLGTHVQKKWSTYNDAMQSLIRQRKGENLIEKTLLKKERYVQ